jgi:hypothetical protein
MVIRDAVTSCPRHALAELAPSLNSSIFEGSPAHVVVSSLCFAIIAFSVGADAAAGDLVGFPAFQIKQTPCSVWSNVFNFYSLFMIFSRAGFQFCRSQSNPYHRRSSPWVDFLASKFPRIISCFPFRCLLGCSVLMQILTIWNKTLTSC